MFKGLKRVRLRRAYAQVQSYAQEKKAWGNNFTTLIVMNKIVNDYYKDLFDSERLLDNQRSKIIKSSFGSLQDMMQWLSGVRSLCKEAASGEKVELSGNLAYLNIQKQHEVPMADFLYKDGYPINLNEAFKNIHVFISEISSYLESCNNNQRQYFDLRLGNGINTVLVFHELLLEVMMNEQ